MRLTFLDPFQKIRIATSSIERFLSVGFTSKLAMAESILAWIDENFRMATEEGFGGRCRAHSFYQGRKPELEK